VDRDSPSNEKRKSHTGKNINSQTKDLDAVSVGYLPLTRTQRKLLTCGFATPQRSPALCAPRDRARSVRNACANASMSATSLA
jgi:hypothetical protein